MPFSGLFKFNYGRIPIVIIFIATQYFRGTLAIYMCRRHNVDHKNNYERMPAVKKGINNYCLRTCNFSVEMTVEVGH
jgi:hypothetical protein